MAALNESEQWALFHERTSPASLERYWRAVPGAARGRDGISPVDFAMTLPEVANYVSNKVQSGTYSFQAYREVLRLRGANRTPRQISVPTVRDRGVLRAILEILREVLPGARGINPAGVAPRIQAAVRSGRYSHFLRVDIRDFYPSISHAAIDDRLSGAVIDPLRNLVMNAVRRPTLPSDERDSGRESAVGVPQGLPISNAIAELVLSDTDAHYTAWANIAYFRYVDDVLFLLPKSKIRDVYDDFTERVSRVGLRTHPLNGHGSKSLSGEIGEPIEFLGYRFTSTNTGVRNESVNRFKSRLVRHVRIFQQRMREGNSSLSQSEWENLCLYQLNWYLRLAVAGCQSEGRRWGWLNYFSGIDDFQLLRSLDYFVTQKTAGVTGVEVPSFVSVYRELKSTHIRRRGNIVNLDSFSYEEQVETLTKVFRHPLGYLLTLERVDVEKLFQDSVRQDVLAMERDLGFTYGS